MEFNVYIFLKNDETFTTLITHEWKWKMAYEIWASLTVESDPKSQREFSWKLVELSKYPHYVSKAMNATIFDQLKCIVFIRIT